MNNQKRAGPPLIAGLDEVGMGCLAGPLVVCVAAFPESRGRMAEVKDSKRCSPSLRERLLGRIVEEAAFIGVGYATAGLIDKKGMARAWQRAAEMALEHAPTFEQLIVDGTRSVRGHIGSQLTKPKADLLHWQVSAASIVAKVLRDSHMKCLGEFYQGYGWHTHSGYGTQKHIEAILPKGETRYHRAKFLRKIYEQSRD
jgi:ribonuclease HII